MFLEVPDLPLCAQICGLRLGIGGLRQSGGDLESLEA
jgi:hypothetical protein